MIARCVYNSGRDLGPQAPGARHTDQTRYDLRPGARYRVWGMEVFRTPLNLLVYGDGGTPFWYPIQLFEVEEQPLPGDWEFRLKAPSAPGVADMRAIWGYPTLVRDVAHRDGMLEREPADLDLFFTKLAEAALADGLWSSLRETWGEQAIQLSELLEGLGRFLDRPPGDSSLIRPAAMAIQLLVDRGELVVGELQPGHGEPLRVEPWELGPGEAYRRIQQEWAELEKPKHVNAIAWLEPRSGSS